MLLGGGLYHLGLLFEERDLPAGPRSASACGETWRHLPPNLLANVKPERLHPSKIVIEPWKGRHYVYAEFDLPPKGYFINDRFRIELENFGSFCGVAASEDRGGKGVATARLRTRTAIWLISQGKFNALHQPENWQLEIIAINDLRPQNGP
jgi:hypothetical protein